MKKLLILCAGLLVFSASASFAAGLDLTWKNCVGETTQQDINFTNCSTASTSVTFFSCFKSPVPLPNFVAAGLTYDMQEEAVAALDRFYRFDATASGGCNDIGLAIRHTDEPSDAIFCDSETSPWGFQGGSAGSALTGFIAGFNGVPNRGRQFAAVNRDAADPFPLDVAVNYYMCAMTINTQRRATCAGCGGKIAIVFNDAELAENTNNRVHVFGPDKLGNCVTINHAGPVTCAATPTRKTTWGQLKSIYR